MNTTKWLFLVSSVVMTAIPGVVLFRDWRHYDKRTNLYKRFTKILVLLQLLAAAGVARGMYKDLSKRDKLPLLVPFLNNLLITNDVCITFPTTNSSQDFEFSFINVGDETANGLVVEAQFPAAVNVIPSGKWRSVGSFNLKDRSPVLDRKCFSIDADYLTPSNVAAIFVPLTVQATNALNTVNMVDLRSSMLNGDSKSWTFWIHFTNGPGSPHLGF